MLFIHAFLFVQALEKGDTIIKNSQMIKSSTVKVKILSHFICDLPTDFGMEDIWRVSDAGVPEVVWLLTILSLLQKEQEKLALIDFL